MAARVGEYDPRLVLSYDGRGRWRLTYGREPVLTWEQATMGGPPDERMVRQLRRVDQATGRAKHLLRDIEEREERERARRQAAFDDITGYIARDKHKYFVRDVDGAPDHRTQQLVQGLRG